MNKNVGSIDKIVRYLLSAGLAVLAFTLFPVQHGNWIGVALLVVAAIFVVTSLISWCPIWAALRIRTNSK